MKRIFCFICFFALILPINVSAVSTSAKASVVINADTNEVLYSHNADIKLSMASTTKIMTALLLCEAGDFEKEIVVTAEMLRVEGSSMGLLAGDRVRRYDLLYGMMLASGNDAANVTAYELGGTVDGFVKLMNDKAKAIGMKNTNFETPSGLDAKEHYSTAYDMAILASFALKNPDFKKAVSSEKATLFYGNEPYKRTLTNHNRLLKSYPYAIGVKTGFTKKSGRCLVSAARKDGKTVIAVTLNDPNDWVDHKNLLDFGLNSIKLTEIVPKETSYKIDVISGVETELNVKIEPIKISYFKENNFDSIVNLPRFLYAPIKKGEKIGSVDYISNGEIFKTVDILADNDIKIQTVKTSKTDNFKEKIILIFKKIWES